MRWNECGISLTIKRLSPNDPIQIVHQIRNLSGRTTADIEVCAILTAMVSWGQRSHIIYCAEKLMNVWMGAR
jgi:hypothetical protein